MAEQTLHLEEVADLQERLRVIMANAAETSERRSAAPRALLATQILYVLLLGVNISPATGQASQDL